MLGHTQCLLLKNTIVIFPGQLALCHHRSSRAIPTSCGPVVVFASSLGQQKVLFPLSQLYLCKVDL